MFNPTPQQIARIVKAEVANVIANWPKIKTQLDKFGVSHDSGLLAAVATIGTEVPAFTPISEYGDDDYFFRMYDMDSLSPMRRRVALSLGNVKPGDGVRFHGRGFIQTTGRSNYKALTPVLGIDCEAFPDTLLEVDHAATALAHYFRTHGVDAWAEKAWNGLANPCRFCPGNGLLNKQRPSLKDAVCCVCGWKTVRRTVNGGLNGWDRFYPIVQALRCLA